MKHYKIMSLLLVLFLLSACGTGERKYNIDLAYAVQNYSLETKAQIFVEEFNYTPPHLLTHAQIKINSLESMIFPASLGVYYQKAVEKEFRFSGISVKEGKCRLKGKLNKLHILNSNTVMVEANYVLHDRANKIAYSESHEAKSEKNYRYSPYAYASDVNTAISKNIGKLLSDEKFIKALKRC